ncbi:hypothetical protein V8D89_009828 [Ganoderma adspersum]
MPELLLNNSAISTFGTLDVNTVAPRIIRESTISARDAMIQIYLASFLFGVLTILSFTPIFFLIGHLHKMNVKVLVLSTILLYLSTSTYLAALIWNRSQANYLVLGATTDLFSPVYDGKQEISAFEDTVWKQSWMTVTAVVANYLLDTPAVFGSIGYCELKIMPMTKVTLLITNNGFIKAATAISFSTNTFATALTAYKMWKHRRLSRVLNALALLVECGTIYCALLTSVMVHQADPGMSRAGAGRMFTRVVECFIYGCLTPLVAIYPIIIIVLVALKRSPINMGGLSQVHLDDAGLIYHSEGTESTLVFRHSIIRNFSGRGMEDQLVEQIWPGADNPQSIVHSQESSTIRKSDEVVGQLL